MRWCVRRCLIWRVPVREFGYRGAHMTSVTESPAEADLAVADLFWRLCTLRLFVMIWVVLAVWIRLLVWSCTPYD